MVLQIISRIKIHQTFSFAGDWSRLNTNWLKLSGEYPTDIFPSFQNRIQGFKSHMKTNATIAEWFAFAPREEG